MITKIFLDDYRLPKDCVSYMYKRIGDLNPIYLEEWIVVKNYNEFIEAVAKNYERITHISFDHDLADEHIRDVNGLGGREYKDISKEELAEYEKIRSGFVEKTGYDCAKWLKEFYEERKLKLPIMFVHSMNPVGTQNIINLFK